MKTTRFPHALALVLIGAALAGAPARAVGQVTTITGRVTNEAGIGIADAHVYVLGDVVGTPRPGEAVVIRQIAQTRTAPDGAYTIKVPFGAEKPYFELRVRMEGYLPETHTVRSGDTPQVENFRLRADPPSTRSAQLPAASAIARVYGNVSTEAGVALDSAQVYINDLNIMVRTNSAGDYTFDTPARNQMVNLRVRALGCIPGVQTIRLGVGPQETHFKLKGCADGPRDESRVVSTKTTVPSTKTSTKMPATTQGTEPARVPFSVAQAAQTPVSEAADPFGRLMFTPEQVMQHQNAISLRDAQRETLQIAIQQAQTQVVKLQWALAQDTEKLTLLLNASSLEEKDVLAQTDRIMAIERDIKRAQMTLLIKIKNTLTPEQQTKLRQLRGGGE